MNDGIGAIRDWLAAQPAIVALVADRIYINRLPRSVIEAEDTYRPRKMLVIQQFGGIGRADYLALDNLDINILCYGETDLEADKVRREAWDAMRLLSRVRQNNVLIHHINPVSGPTPSRDPDIVWPIITQSFQTLTATEV